MIISYYILLNPIINNDISFIFNPTFIILTIYTLMWFLSLYKLYYFKKIGLNIYISLLILGIIMNFLGDISNFGKFMTILSLLEHLIIGSIITLSIYSPIKRYFN